MKSALVDFQANLARARALGKLPSVVPAAPPGADVSDILRSVIVLAVSALDHFVHEIVRRGMIEIAKGQRAETAGYLKFKVPLTATKAALADPASASWIDDAVKDAHSWLSFQHPEKIADVLKLISAVSVWEEVSAALNLSSLQVKTQLKAIADRRNKIAHEADMNPAFPGERWPIDDAMVEETLRFIEAVADAILRVI